MTNSLETGNCYPSATLSHCPLCGGELQSGTDDRAFECPVCEYTEQEVANA